MSSPDAAVATRAARSLAVTWAPLAALSVIVLLVPLFLARPAHLTSDESLYLAEAYNIAHGHGLTYPSGEAITHRAPLFPIVLAPAVAVSTELAYAVSALIIAANAILLMWLTWRMAGPLAGATAGIMAAASAYLGGLGTTLYLDPFECTFMILALLALHRALEGPPLRWFAAAGAAMGFAFLAKESAITWAPLGVVAWLAVPGLRTREGACGALAYTGAFVATIAPWWVWVYAHTGDLFLLGAAAPWQMAALVLLAGSATAFVFGIRRWPAVPPEGRALMRGIAPVAALVIIAAWCAFLLVGLTVYSSWGYPNNYAETVPRYIATVTPAVQPYFLVVIGWVWVAALAFRRDDNARLIAAVALLFFPFALFIANRDLQLRDVLPLIYLSYIVLGIVTAAVVGFLRRFLSEPAGHWLVGAGLALLAVTFALQQATVFRIENDERSFVGVRPDSWDSPFVRDIAAWMNEHLPDGSRVLSSRLYFSSLHTETDARFEIRQIPTVRVDVDEDGERLLVPRSNLFRWGDADLRVGDASDQWLYLRQFPGKAYWVALSQQELLEYIDTHEIEYVVLTGEDVAFSSLAYASYLTAHPAFELVAHQILSAGDQLYVYAVRESARLEPMPHSLVINPYSAAQLADAGVPVNEVSERLGVPVRVTDQEGGLSQREYEAALAGADLGE